MIIRTTTISAMALAATAGLVLAGPGSAEAGGYDCAEKDHLSGTSIELAEGHDEVRRLQQEGDILSLEHILQQARQQHAGGRVLETELEHERGRYVYEVELLDEHGQVWEMKLDAQTGEMLRQEQED